MIACSIKTKTHPDIDELLKKMQLDKEKVNRLIAEALRITGKIHRDDKEKNCLG